MLIVIAVEKFVFIPSVDWLFRNGAWQRTLCGVSRFGHQSSNCRLELFLINRRSVSNEPSRANHVASVYLRVRIEVQTPHIFFKHVRILLQWRHHSNHAEFCTCEAVCNDFVSLHKVWCVIQFSKINTHVGLKNYWRRRHGSKCLALSPRADLTLKLALAAADEPSFKLIGKSSAQFLAVVGGSFVLVVTHTSSFLIRGTTIALNKLLNVCATNLKNTSNSRVALAPSRLRLCPKFRSISRQNFVPPISTRLKSASDSDTSVLILAVRLSGEDVSAYWSLKFQVVFLTNKVFAICWYVKITWRAKHICCDEFTNSRLQEIIWWRFYFSQ